MENIQDLLQKNQGKLFCRQSELLENVDKQELSCLSVFCRLYELLDKCGQTRVVLPVTVFYRLYELLDKCGQTRVVLPVPV